MGCENSRSKTIDQPDTKPSIKQKNGEQNALSSVAKNQLQNSKSYNEKIIDEIKIQSLNGLNLGNIQFQSDGEALKPPYLLTYGQKYTLSLQNCTGFSETKQQNEIYVNAGFSIAIYESSGKQIYNQNDLFPTTVTQYYKEDCTNIDPFVIIKGDNFKPNETFTWVSRYWDKNGAGSLTITFKFKINAECFEVARLVSFQQVGDLYQANFMGKTAWINGKSFKSYFNKSSLQLLQTNENNLVELHLVYDKSYFMGAKNNVIAFQSKDNIIISPFAIKQFKSY